MLSSGHRPICCIAYHFDAILFLPPYGLIIADSLRIFALGPGIQRNHVSFDKATKVLLGPLMTVTTLVRIWA